MSLNGQQGVVVVTETDFLLCTKDAILKTGKTEVVGLKVQLQQHGFFPTAG